MAWIRPELFHKTSRSLDGLRDKKWRVAIVVGNIWIAAVASDQRF
jgi:hypothetical protein